MSQAEFLAWLKGFLENIDGAMTEEQVSKIKNQLGSIPNSWTMTTPWFTQDTLDTLYYTGIHPIPFTPYRGSSGDPDANKNITLCSDKLPESYNYIQGT